MTSSQGKRSAGAGNTLAAIGKVIYERFEQEAEIDRRILKDFANSIENAHPKTSEERVLVERSMNLFMEMRR